MNERPPKHETKVAQATIGEIQSVSEQILRFNINGGTVRIDRSAPQEVQSLYPRIEEMPDEKILIYLSRSTSDSYTCDDVFLIDLRNGNTSKQHYEASWSDSYKEAASDIGEVMGDVYDEIDALGSRGLIDSEAERENIQKTILDLVEFIKKDAMLRQQVAFGTDEETREYALRELESMIERFRIGDEFSDIIRQDDKANLGELSHYLELIQKVFDTIDEIVKGGYAYAMDCMKGMASAVAQAQRFNPEDAMSEYDGWKLLAELDRILEATEKYHESL